MTDKSMTVTNVEVAALKEYKNNPRNNDAAVPDMVALIEQFGFQVPILVKGDRIVDGHLRIKAAKEMGLVTVPAIDVGDLTDAQEKALRIAINKSVDWAEWDVKKLDAEFKILAKAGLDLKFTGFNGGEIARMTKQAMGDDAVKKMVKPMLPKNKDADAGAATDPNYTSLTFHMGVERRDEVQAILKSIMEQEELGNVSQALIWICKSFSK